MTALESCTLSQTRRSLSALAYFLRRLLRFESAWVLHIARFEDKVTLGLALGFSGQMLDFVALRQRELGSAADGEWVTRSGRTLATFDAQADTVALTGIAAFVVGANRELGQTVAWLRTCIDPLYDQPTLWALDCVTRLLEEKSAMLATRGWHGGHCDCRLLTDDHAPAALRQQDRCPPLLDQPRRPQEIQLGDAETPGPAVLVQSEAGQRQLVHYIYSEIEVAAAETCARNIAEFGDGMPLQFVLDMARQCADEARHAVMAEQMLAHYGGWLGEFNYRNRIWNAYIKGESLAERLAIEQVIGEGNGLDMSAHCMDLFKQHGLDRLLRYYEFLQADEIGHCAFGNRWIRYLVDGDEQRFTDVVASAARKTGSGVPGYAPVCVETRRAAGFSEQFIAQQLLKGAAGETASRAGLPGT